MSRHPPIEGGSVAVADDGSTVVAVGSSLNFVDTASNTVLVTDMGGGVAKVEVTATGAGGGGAGTNMPFVVVSNDASLSAERRLQVEASVLTLTDGGANGDITVGVATAGITYAKFQDITARSLVGRAANSSGVGAAIAGGGAGTYANDNATSLAFRAITDIIQNLNISGDISPAQITADQNDYNPTSLSTSTVLRLDLDAARAITGIAGGADGRVLILYNISAFTLTLTDASASSSAANRFDFGASVALATKQAAAIQYDSTSSRWRLLARPVAFTPANSTISLTAGAGMTGGGDLSANRTFNVVANADGTIVVNADDIQVGTLIAANVPSALITYAKIQNLGALAVMGRSANSGGVGADIQATAASGAVLRESGSTIGFGTVVAAGLASDSVTTVKILDANVTYAKIQNVGARSIFGRSANSAGVGADIAGGGGATFLSDDASTLAFRVVTELPQNIVFSGDLTPSQITANQNDYNPTSLSTASLLRLSTDASRNITGIAGGADGRILTLLNVGSFPIVLVDASTSSTAGNRFDMGRTLTLLPKRSLVLWYDSTASRWKPYDSGGEQTVSTLTDGANIATNRDLGWQFTVTLGGNRTMDAPSGTLIDGMWLFYAVFQDGTGSRTLTFATGAGAFRATELSLSQTLSTAAGKCDYFVFRYNSTDNRFDLMDFRKAA